MVSFFGKRATEAKSASSTPSEQDAPVKNEWVLVSPRIMIGFVGVVACFAWLFLTLGTSIFVPFVDSEGFAIGTVHFCFVIGVCITLFLCRLLSDYLGMHKSLHLILATVFTIIGCVGLGLQEAASFSWIFGGLMGCGFGFIYVLYGEFVCVFFNSAFKPYIYGIFACAILACAGILFVGSGMGFWFGILFPAISLVAYVLVYFFFRLEKQPVVDHETSDSRHKVVWRSYLATTTAGLAAGFAFGCILSTQNLGSWAYILIEVVVFAVCLFMFIDSLRNNKLNETVTMRLFLPFSAVIVFPLIFVPESFRFIFALLLLCGSLFPITLSLSAICKHIVICRLSPIRVFSFGRLMNFLGIALGLILGFIAFSEASIHAFGSVITVLTVIVFMVLVIFSASFVMTEDNYPDENRFRQAKASGEGMGNDFSPSPGIPIRGIAQDHEGDSYEHERRNFDRPGVFYSKCEQVAKKYGLSARQKEVLIMLAKGRNAEYITEKLVISSHTAKAHIYNIYQKTGVHSRQELMDLVEETELPA